MTRAEIKSRVPILQAWLEQVPIQSLYMFNTRSEWEDYVIEKPPDIFNPSLEWRVKPPQPPNPREWFLVINPQGKVAQVHEYTLLPLLIEHDDKVVHVREVLSDPPANASPLPQTGDQDPRYPERNPS
jgi:hypothetical protein